MLLFQKQASKTKGSASELLVFLLLTICFLQTACSPFSFLGFEHPHLSEPSLSSTNGTGKKVSYIQYGVRMVCEAEIFPSERLHSGTGSLSSGQFFSSYRMLLNQMPVIAQNFYIVKSDGNDMELFALIDLGKRWEMVHANSYLNGSVVNFMPMKVTFAPVVSRLRSLLEKQNLDSSPVVFSRDSSLVITPATDSGSYVQRDLNRGTTLFSIPLKTKQYLPIAQAFSGNMALFYYLAEMEPNPQLIMVELDHSFKTTKLPNAADSKGSYSPQIIGSHIIAYWDIRAPEVSNLHLYNTWDNKDFVIPVNVPHSMHLAAWMDMDQIIHLVGTDGNRLLYWQYSWTAKTVWHTSTIEIPANILDRYNLWLMNPLIRQIHYSPWTNEVILGLGRNGAALKWNPGTYDWDIIGMPDLSNKCLKSNVGPEIRNIEI